MNKKVIFEYTAGAFFYRGVENREGGYQMEKKVVASKRFKPYMWTGGLDSLMKYNEQYWRDLYAKRGAR